MESKLKSINKNKMYELNSVDSAITYVIVTKRRDRGNALWLLDGQKTLPKWCSFTS